MTQTSPFIILGVSLATAWVVSTAAQASPQGRPGLRAKAGAAAAEQDESGNATVSPAQLEKWFDSYVILQAQDSLKLTDVQFPRFLQRLRTLQEIRRRNLQARRQLLAQLAQLVKAQPFDEAQARDRLKALSDLDAKASEESRRAYDSLTEGLDALQQVRFRLLEESVERKKIDLLTRARRAAQAPSPSR